MDSNLAKNKHEMSAIYFADQIKEALKTGRNVHIPGTAFRGEFEIKIRGDRARMIMRRVFGRMLKDDIRRADGS